MLKRFSIIVLALLLTISLDSCKKEKKEPAENVSEVKEAKASGARPQRTKKIKDALNGLEEEDRVAALKLLREEHREQKNKKDENEEEEVELTPGFFPVSDGARQLIEEANLLLRQGADSDSKIEALENLIDIDHPDILPTIELALDDKDPVVR
ncbi:hypothetical protein IKZ80_06995, partial [bacterium]|nr:hypothetical protein [bacterium]